MTHRATARFWQHYDRLPGEVQALADKALHCLNKIRGILRFISKNWAEPNYGRCALTTITALSPSSTVTFTVGIGSERMTNICA